MFQQLAEQNLETLKQSKVQKIVSICPHCVRTISTDWREFGEAPPIEHHSEFMARYIGQTAESRNASQKIVYHDPCYLGRYRGVYDEPRDGARRWSGEVIDPPRSRERSFCCGAGGGLAFLGEEKGDRVSHNRAKELVATGADVVGAACPFCNTMFRDALAAVSDAPPKLLDIAQIAAASLPPKPDKKLVGDDGRRPVRRRKGSVSGFTRTAVENFIEYFRPPGNVSSMKYAVYQPSEAFRDFADVHAVLLFGQHSRFVCRPDRQPTGNRASPDSSPATISLRSAW